MDMKLEEGSFTDQQNKSKCDLRSELEALRKSIDHINDNHNIFTSQSLVCLSFSDGLYEPCGSEIVVGLPVIVVNNSKFCSGNLLRAYNRINQLLGPMNTNSEDRCFSPSMKVCDVSKKHWSINHWIAQKESLKFILDTLLEMEDNSCLLLTGFPLLTQFNVGLVYVIGQAFEQVGFEDPKVWGYRLFFQQLKKHRLQLIFRDCLENVKNQSSSLKEAVLSFVPIKSLCEKGLYSTVLAVNHIYLKYCIDQRISQVLRCT